MVVLIKVRASVKNWLATKILLENKISKLRLGKQEHGGFQVTSV